MGPNWSNFGAKLAIYTVEPVIQTRFKRSVEIVDNLDLGRKPMVFSYLVAVETIVLLDHSISI
jgi:hypothetical protein